MRSVPKQVMAAALGAGGAVAVDLGTARALPRGREAAAAAGLLTAAAIYPLARRRRFGDAAERATVLAAAGVVAAALLRPARRRPLLAAGWLAHAAFDAAFTPHDASRIPSWYPAMCAGYDAAMAARLASTPRLRRSERGRGRLPAALTTSKWRS